MLNTLQFNMSVPTPYVFMRRYLKAAQSDRKVSANWNCVWYRFRFLGFMIFGNYNELFCTLSSFLRGNPSSFFESLKDLYRVCLGKVRCLKENILCFFVSSYRITALIVVLKQFYNSERPFFVFPKRWDVFGQHGKNAHHLILIIV